MRKIFVVTLALSLLFFSCGVRSGRTAENAGEVMEALLSEFSPGDGFFYSDGANAEYPLTDAVLERMFPGDGDLEDLFCVTSAAVWFSKRFSEHEIIVFELCDRSHRERIVGLLEKRARKKENAVVFADGVYVYLICTDSNEAISRYLRS